MRALSEVETAALAGFRRFRDFQRAMRMGQFPKPDKLLPDGPRWSETRLAAWFAGEPPPGSLEAEEAEAIRRAENVRSKAHGAQGQGRRRTEEVPAAKGSSDNTTNKSTAHSPGAFVPPMFSVAQVAERWQVDGRVIQRMVDRGELPCLRAGRTIRIPRVAVEKLELEGSSRTVPEAIAVPAPGRSPLPSRADLLDIEARAEQIARGLRLP